MRRVLRLLSISALAAAGCAAEHPSVRAPGVLGDRGFQASGSLGLRADRTASVQLGDLDGDGDLDAVVANGRHWPESNEVFFNDGRGRFLQALELCDERDTSYAVPLGDFDADGDLDVAVGNDRVRCLLHLNDGAGSFRPGPSFGSGDANTRSLTAVDLDQDGHLDLLTLNISFYCFNSVLARY